MSKYNLTDRQKRLLSDIVSACRRSGQETFRFWHNSKFEGVIFDKSPDLNVPCKISELGVFDRVGLGHLANEEFTITGHAIEAVDNDFEMPTTAPSVGIGTYISGHVSGGTVQSAVGDHNSLTTQPKSAVAVPPPLHTAPPGPDEGRAASALAELIRSVRSAGQAHRGNPNYDPKTIFFIQPEPGGGAAHCGLLRDIGNPIVTAYRAGVFDADIFRDVKGEVRPAAVRGQGEVAGEALLYWLSEQGYNVLGADSSNDPFERLADALEAVSKSLHRPKSPTLVRSRRFAVAFSFPGDHRSYVEAVDHALAHSIPAGQIFYDNRYKHELARPSLDAHLQKIYHDETDLLVVFLCAEYDRKEWCGLEWRAIRDLIKCRREQDVMLFRFDNADIPGIFSIDGYVDATRHSPERAAELIHRRLLSNRAGG